MRKLTRDTIQQLLESSETPKVTIYIPLDATAAPSALSENQIRFKNLMHTACAELAAANSPAMSKKLHEFFEKNHADSEFWQNRTHGMLLLHSGDTIELFDLPTDTEEYVAVDDTFHIAPVLALLDDDRAYYVLALAQQNPKLYQGDMYGLQPLSIDLPANMRDELGIDEANPSIENQGSASGTGASGNGGNGYNGRGGSRDLLESDRLRFFHNIDNRLLANLDRSIPLIVAGVDAEIAEFKNLSKYPQILDGVISGNQTANPVDELTTKAAAIIRGELISPAHVAAREEYQRLQGANPERVARGSDDIATAAEQGKIDKLLAMMSRHTTDTVQDNMDAVLRITFPEPATSKLLNKLALQVWLMRGKVMSLLPQEMPNGDVMVARLRY